MYRPFNKGKKLSETHRQHLRENHKGMTGMKHSPETIEKMRRVAAGRVPTGIIGKPMSEDHKRKIGLANSGERSANWIADRSVVMRNKRNDPEYQQWVKRVKRRDSNVCGLESEECEGQKIAHHILSWAKHPEVRYETQNGIILCKKHHPTTRPEEERLVPVFQKLLSNPILI